MTAVLAREAFDRLHAGDDRALAAADVEARLADAGVVQRWLDARVASLTGTYTTQSPTPELGVAQALRLPFRDADVLVRRAQLTEACPALAQALTAGVLSGEHVDVIERGIRLLQPDERVRFFTEQVPALVRRGEHVTSESFTPLVRRARDRVRQARDPEEQHRRQREATRLVAWVDRSTGMWRISGEFDQAGGLVLERLLRARAEALFHGKHPDTTPADPIQRQQHLLALALVDLLTNGGGRAGRIDLTGVVDLTDNPGVDVVTIDWGLPGIEVDPRVLRALLGKCQVTPVVVQDGKIVWAPGRLNLGRTSRLPNKAQRRALSALYRCCPVPGCGVAYQHTNLHHVVAWEDGGATDLDNLIPLCARHHHYVHARGWTLQLGPRRELTVTTPDGTVMTTGPPRRRTAA